MRADLSFVIVSLWLAHCAAKQYDGDFCDGVIDFAIDDAANVAVLDAGAKNSYSFFPRWIAEECLAAVWKFSCMYEYGKLAEDGRGYCRDACIATLDSCQDTIELLGDEGATYVAAINVLCSSPSDTSAAADCHAGGQVTYADVPSGFGAVCPKPLGRAVAKEGTSMQSISGTACALPCPPIAFTHDEWFTVRGIMKWCSFVSFVLSLAVVLAHPEQKNYYIRLLNIGGTLLSLLIFVFLIVDDYEEQVCVDDVHYYKRAPFCLTQAFLSVGLYVWMLLWQACIAANLWITVVLQVKGEQLKAIQQKYLPICATCSLVAPITSISAGNLGYDWPGFTGPMCLFLFSEEEGYYWALFFTPIVLIVVTSLVLMTHSIFYVNKVLSLQKGSVSLGKGLKRFLKLVKYNRKMFQFMLCFCLIGGYQCGQILYSNRFDDSSIAQSTVDYVECLFEHTTTDIWSGIQACGEHPEHRTPIWQVVLLATYYATIGICSFLVYGTQGKARKLIKSGIQSFQTTFRSGTGDKSGESSSSRREGTSYSETSDARSITASPRANSFRWQLRKSPRNTTPRAAAAAAKLEADEDAQL